jgi:hypothetical protein
MNPVLRVDQELDVDDMPVGRGLWVWCPGCRQPHRPIIANEDGTTGGGPRWEWDGNLDAPTISPSLLVFGSVYLHDDGSQCPDWHDDYETRAHTQGNCHSFIRAGRWEFLSDCAHELAGQTVDMVPLPDWMVG